MIRMEQDIEKYFRKHTTMIVAITIILFAILGIGEVALYRNQAKLNQMIAEGLMQIKEGQKPTAVITVEPSR